MNLGDLRMESIMEHQLRQDFRYAEDFLEYVQPIYEQRMFRSVIIYFS